MSGAATDRPSGSSLRARRLARLTGLYAITPDLDDTPRLVALCAAALDGGAVAIQYRNKSAPPALAFEQATALVALARGRGALLVVNDDPALAAHVDADGVHVGTDDGGVARARAIVGPDRLVGASCYDRVEDARDAVAQGADHVAFGSFYASPTKPQARRAGLDLPARARALGVPIVAIGGIDERNAGELARAGVDAIAAIQAVFGDARPAGVAAAARRVASAFAAGRAGDRSSGGAPATIPPAARGGASRPSLPGAQPMSRNDELFARAQRTIPAGVNSPVRAFRSVGGTPRFLVRGEGPYVWDADGRRYTDYVGSWGPAIVGHAHPAVVAAVQKTAVHGVSFGAPTEIEIEMAETLVRRLPSLELVRLVSSGTEATMSALRLARGFTGRPKIVKFEGCYHGHGDSLLVKAGSGALTFGQPSSAGVPPEIANQTIVLPYNDAAALEAAFAADGASIAGVIVEPVAGNMNLVHPAPGFLERLRRVCDRHGAVLIFDEVMTGFRVHPRGVQGMTGVTPDLTTLGKVIGGGMPVGAFGGRRDIMNLIAPLGPVYQAGTLSGNPVAVAAGLATLALTEAPGFYETLSARTRALTDGLTAAAKRAGVPFCAQAVGGMFGLYFAPRVPSSYAEIMACDKERFNRYFHAMLDAGVYFAPSAYEAGFVSAAHTDADIADTIERASGAFSRLA